MQTNREKATGKRLVILDSAAKMPNSCWGSYRRVALVECPLDWSPAIIRETKRVAILMMFDRLNVGKTERCAYRKALARVREYKRELEACHD